MGRSGSTSMLFLAVLVAIALGSASSPAGAEDYWTKFYECTNATDTAQHGIRVTLLDPESIPASGWFEGEGMFQRTKCKSQNCANPPTYPIPPPKGTCWYPARWWVVPGGGGTVITYPGYEDKIPNWNNYYLPLLTDTQRDVISIPVGGTVTIGWTVIGNHCRPTEVAWHNGLGAPSGTYEPDFLEGMSCTDHGGGVAFFDYPAPGDLTVAITNDHAAPRAESSSGCGTPGLGFEGVEYAISPAPLTMDELKGILSDGFEVQGRLEDRVQELTDLLGPEYYRHSPAEVKCSEYVPWSSIVRRERLLPKQYTEIVIPGPLHAAKEARTTPCAEPGVPKGGALIIRGELRDDKGHTFKWLDQIVVGEAPRLRGKASPSQH